MAPPDAFADTLNGTTWTITAHGGPGFNVGLFYAVSCFPASVKAVRCAAVGTQSRSPATRHR
jgi:hypothetical protein